MYPNYDPENIPWIRKFDVSVTEKSNHFNLQVTIDTIYSSRGSATFSISKNINSINPNDKHWHTKSKDFINNDNGKTTFNLKLKESDLNDVWRIQIHYSENNEHYEYQRILLFSELNVNLVENNDNSSLFPERKLPQYKDRVDTGVCFSGGGTRAMLLAMGQMRYLHNKGYAKNIGYYSSVSGGSWAASIYGFAPQNNINKLLGTYTTPNKSSDLINNSEIPEMALGTQNLQFLSTLVCNLASYIKNKDEKDTNQTLNRWWIESIGLAFLASNNLSTPFNESLESFTLDQFSLDSILENQGSLQQVKEKQFRFVNTKRENGSYPPFYIANSLMLRPTNGRNGLYIPYEYTPLYQGAGFNGMLDYSNTHIGGGNLPMYAYDTEVISKVKDNKVWVMRQTANSLANLTTATGTSSSAFAGATSSDGIINILKLIRFILSYVNSLTSEQFTQQINNYKDSLTEQLTQNNSLLESWNKSGLANHFTKEELSETISFILNHIDDLTPKANYFSPAKAQTSLENTLFNFGDAGLSDNFGLMALLRRQVKKIVVFVNTETQFEYKQNDSVIDETVKAFFGIAPKDDTITGIHLENMQVFEKKLFNELINDFKRCQEKGETLVSKSTYRVSKNAHWDIINEYDVEILWHYNCRPANWENEINNNALEILDTKGIQEIKPLKNPGKFPHYGTFAATILGLNSFEINMLANIAEWNLAQTDHLLSELLQVKETASV